MKRFYKDVSISAADGGYLVELDGRVVKTPGKETLLIPTKALADAVAAEWQEQSEEINPDSMPLTKLANTALDRVLPRFDAVAAEIANFAGTDLLCYRTDEPADLVEHQNEIWNPYLIWAEEAFGVKLDVTDGIMPITQPAGSLEAIGGAVFAHDAFELTALHEFTNGFGSVILGLAYMREFAPFEDLWLASILDQQHQEETWGEDYEALEKKEKLLADLNAACEFLSHVRNKTSGQPG